MKWPSLLFFAMIIIACAKNQPNSNFSAKEKQEQAKPIQTKDAPTHSSTEILPEREPEPTTSNTNTSVPPTRSSSTTFPWLTNYDPQQSLVNQIHLPEGYKRIRVPENSIGTWIRQLPLKDQSEPVYLFNGQLKGNQSAHHRVMDIDIGKRDLQQCADAVMRLKAEYHFSKKEYSKIHFNYTSGDRVSFEDWRKGRKPQVKGNKVIFTPKQGKANNSYANFKKYMTQIFNYAGTASLSKELKSISIGDLKIGDVFIQGGFPGHAVLVIDLAENDRGKRIFLLAQSYMPAQNIHVLRNPNNDVENPWYTTDFGSNLETPEWRFSKNDLMRFRE